MKHSITYARSDAENHTTIMRVHQRDEIGRQLSDLKSTQGHSPLSEVGMRARPTLDTGRGSHCTSGDEGISPNCNKLLKAKSEPACHSGTAAGPDTRVHGNKAQALFSSSTGAPEKGWAQVRRRKGIHLVVQACRG